MDLGQAWRGIVAGIKVGFWHGQPVPQYKQGSAQTIKEVGQEIQHLADTVGERGDNCKEAKSLMAANEATVKVFINTQMAGRSNIGSDICRNNEENCGIFLKKYYNWLSKAYIEQAEEVSKIPTIPIPDIPIPKLPGIPWYIKYMIPILVILVIAVVILIAVGYSGLGGAIGSHLTKE